MLRAHLDQFGTDADGRLFRGERGAPLAAVTYTRLWHRARVAALTKDQADSLLARRPYDLRLAAVSSWLNGGCPPLRSPCGPATASLSCYASMRSVSTVTKMPLYDESTMLCESSKCWLRTISMLWEAPKRWLLLDGTASTYRDEVAPAKRVSACAYLQSGFVECPGRA